MQPSTDSPRNEPAARVRSLALLAAILAALVGCKRTSESAQNDGSQRLRAAVLTEGKPVRTPSPSVPLDYTPPPDSAIPAGKPGASIRRGLALILHTTDSLSSYTSGGAQCASCHLDAGRRRDAASLIGVTARYPKYMDRTGGIIPIEDRINHCITRSLAGSRLPRDGRAMKDMVAYLTFLSTGVPNGAHVKGEGMPKMPQLSGDSARGAQLFATTCALCHGAAGQGHPPALPALWGARSYSIGASMAREERAAAFIRHFMPQNNRGSLTDQQAYDLAAYINSQPRPDSPRKERDWPKGGAPRDVPYNTAGHVAYRPPGRLLPRTNRASAIVPPPVSVAPAAATSAGN
jgi:thiosulfate dehydrogenase